MTTTIAEIVVAGFFGTMIWLLLSRVKILEAKRQNDAYEIYRLYCRVERLEADKARLDVRAKR